MSLEENHDNPIDQSTFKKWKRTKHELAEQSCLQKAATSLPLCPYCGDRINIGLELCQHCHQPLSWIHQLPFKPSDADKRRLDIRNDAFLAMQRRMDSGHYNRAIESVREYRKLLKSESRTDVELDQAILKCQKLAARAAFGDMKYLISRSQFRKALDRIKPYKDELLKETRLAGELQNLLSKCESKIKTRNTLIVRCLVLLIAVSSLAFLVHNIHELLVVQQAEQAQIAAAEAERTQRALAQKTLHEQLVAAENYKAELARLISTDPITNSIGMKLKLLPHGTFTRGRGKRYSRDVAHQVTLTRPFYLGVCEVTQEEYERVTGIDRSSEEQLKHAVEQVSWMGAVEFCHKLSELPEEKAAGREYRLPTEAEWEFACRAGTTTLYCFGNDETQLKNYGWSLENSFGTMHPVGQKTPNPWGLYDMHGSVLEWCSDWYRDLSLVPKDVTDPVGPADGRFRVIRGGGRLSAAMNCQSSFRKPMTPSNFEKGTGFRVALSYFGNP